MSSEFLNISEEREAEPLLAPLEDPAAESLLAPLATPDLVGMNAAVSLIQQKADELREVCR
jgi:hypothetical protein